MQQKTPQEYANELLKMYRENARAINEIPVVLPPVTDKPHSFEDGTGGIQVNVTTLDYLYPVKNAFITIFTGAMQNKTVVETGITDQSGKSPIFNLKTPPTFDSQQADNGGALPYASYNISVQSDGYVEKVAMNVPVFSGVVSVQSIDLLPVTAAGKNTAPQIINEENSYNL